MEKTSLYRTIWRWHFYAGLFVVPMVLVLAMTGAVYLFKPQVERWEERQFRNLPSADQVSADQQVTAALAAYPGARFESYRVPQDEGDAALIVVGLAGGDRLKREVFVSPQGQVLGAIDPRWRIMQVTRDIHGQLLLGPRGSWIVELAASWAIVMILSGLYLWWPTGRGLAGVVWPRLASGKRVFWRDLHAVAGFWVAGLAMVLLLTGLPWADVWGSAFKSVREEMGWVKSEQDWTIGGRPANIAEHAEHSAAATSSASHTMPNGSTMEAKPVALAQIVNLARIVHLPFPIIITPPPTPARAATNNELVWTVRSDTQNLPLGASVTFDAFTGMQTSRENFAEKHPIDRVIGYGIAWHEGQLFGPVNQLVGVATALMLVTLAVSGFVMWRRRKPADRFGPPPLPATPAKVRGVAVLAMVLAAFLPMLAISLVVLGLLERLVLRRIPTVASWLGLENR